MARIAHKDSRTPSPSNVARPRLSPAVTNSLQNIDPKLDNEWHQQVMALFGKLDASERKYAFNRHLAPKGIRIDREAKTLIFTGRPSLATLSREIQTPALLTAIAKMRQAQDKLRETSDALAFADLLEASVHLVDSYDAQGILKRQKDKLRVRQAHLDDLVDIVRDSKLQCPQTQRGLTVGLIKDFMIEVFIRHQMLGYRFKLTSIDELRAHSLPFLSGEIADEVELRQCDVITTKRCLFIVGPVHKVGQNPYSIRRFLHEDGGSSPTVFFNSIAIPFNSLDKPKITEHLRWSIGRVLTLERQISQNVISFVNSFKATQRETLHPLLQRAFSADGSDLEAQIRKRLSAYEEILAQQVLSKITPTIQKHVRSNDDLDFLFFYLHAFLLQVSSDVKAFANLYAVTGNSTAEELELRVLGYLRLLEKRKNEIFSRTTTAHNTRTNSQMPVPKFTIVLDEFENKSTLVVQKIDALITAQNKQKSPLSQWFDKVTNGDEKRRVKRDVLQRELEQIKKQCLVALIKVCKHQSDLTVFLELEEVINNIDETRRHYALSAGLQGISELPRLVVLWEDHTQLSFSDIRRRLA